MTTKTRAACVIGWPAKHSRSPKLHGYWLKRYGIDGDYRAEEIKPENFAAFVTHLADNGYVGANVTMPHKDMALELSEPDARATAVAAANTLWLDNGRLRSTNTDVEGFIGALDAAAPGWDKRTTSALVLGAGGASRAVVYGLIERGVGEIVVANRTFDKAVALRDRFGASVVPVRWEDILGMKGQPPLEIDLDDLKAGAAVCDIVYVPLETELLRKARARGHPVVDGLGMLLHQAVPGFECWFGVRPKVTKELRDLIVADLAKDAAR